MSKRNFLWIIGLSLVALTLTAWLIDFNFRHDVDLQFHDTYIVVRPFHAFLVLWLVFTFIAFLVRGFRNRFLNVVIVRILLTANTILVILTSVIAYILFAFFSASALMELFGESGRIDTIADQFNRGMIICAILFCGFIVGEIFLIRRLIRLKKSRPGLK